MVWGVSEVAECWWFWDWFWDCCSFCSRVAEFKIFPVLSALFLGRFVNDIGMQVGACEHHGFQLVSIACRLLSAAAALRDSSDDEPPARATSAASKVWGRDAVGEANRSLWPNSEFHKEFLPANPVLLFSRVQNNHSTAGVS